MPGFLYFWNWKCLLFLWCVLSGMCCLLVLLLTIHVHGRVDGYFFQSGHYKIVCSFCMVFGIHLVPPLYWYTTIYWYTYSWDSLTYYFQARPFLCPQSSLWGLNHYCRYTPSLSRLPLFFQRIPEKQCRIQSCCYFSLSIASTVASIVMWPNSVSSYLLHSIQR